MKCSFFGPSCKVNTRQNLASSKALNPNNMAGDINNQRSRRFISIAFELGAVASVGVLCLLTGVVLMPWTKSIGLPIASQDLIRGIFWGALGATVPLLLRYTTFGRANAYTMPIMTVLWRFGVVAVAILIAAATKWPVDKSFAACLLGCYFPFVILESGLSIRNISQDTRQR